MKKKLSITVFIFLVIGLILMSVYTQTIQKKNTTTNTNNGQTKSMTTYRTVRNDCSRSEIIRKKNTNTDTNDGLTTITTTYTTTTGKDCSIVKSIDSKNSGRNSNRSSNRNSNSNYDSPAELVLERFKRLQGVWKAVDANGREREVVFKRIAKGAFSIKNAFSNPENQMTMFYLDADRELMTNCCLINNQLQSLKTHFDKNKITLTFLNTLGIRASKQEDGNLIFRFTDKGTLILQRNSFQDGQLKLLENIELKRAN